MKDEEYRSRNIDKLLNASRHCKDDKEVLMMILSNRMRDKEHMAIGLEKWDLLCNDIIKWRGHGYSQRGG